MDEMQQSAVDQTPILQSIDEVGGHETRTVSVGAVLVCKRESVYILI